MLPLLLLLFIAIPIAELWLLIKIGGEIGLLPTLALLVVDSLIGAALARSQSRAAWQRFSLALAEGRVPGREVFDGAMIILGGALLLTPGFITDAFGLVLLIPPTRALVRGFLTRAVARRGGAAWRVTTFGQGQGPGGPGGGSGDLGGRGDPSGRPRRGYDYEGSAREVEEPAGEIESDRAPNREARG